jgi:hypothetical protein
VAQLESSGEAIVAVAMLEHRTWLSIALPFASAMRSFENEGETMARSTKFGVFVPQGWKMDLVEIDDPVAKYASMTAVAKAADAEPTIDSIWVYDHFHTIP